MSNISTSESVASAVTETPVVRSRRDQPNHFAHLIVDGFITILGFGSLVSESSAKMSFELTNFRLGSITGYRRVFNRSDWINISLGLARIETGEVCSVSLAKTEETDIISRIALMDVDAGDGLRGFLNREATYDIFEVPYVDDNGDTGVALACGECSDDVIRELWGDDCWYMRRCSGKITYFPYPDNRPMPLTPELQVELPGQGLVLEPGYATQFLPLTVPSQQAVYQLPSQRDWVYPSPGYLRMVCRAYNKAGSTMIDNFLDYTLLADKMTSVRDYLAANPALQAWVLDPALYDNRFSDRW
jgi:hypothetical protein